MDGGDDAGSDCPAGLMPCGGFCVDRTTDHENCGACGNRCQPVETCVAARCLVECPAALTFCAGACVDTRTSLEHCGACSSPCTPGVHAVHAACEGGLCKVTCEAGWSDPDADGTCDVPCVSTGDAEACNGLDDNCDGDVDEGFSCRMGQETACTTSCGSLGSGICAADCTPPGAEACNVRDELCNGADDDCDGACDNSFECCRGTTLVGGDCGVSGHEESTCTVSCAWSEPSCIDEGECTPGVTQACGDCGTQTCDAAGRWGTCTGEGVCSPGATQACGSCGTQTCSGTCRWDVCTGEVDCSRPHAVGGTCSGGACSGYSCEGGWDNCDGNWDNGCEIPVGTANACSAHGLDPVAGCGTAWCGSSGSLQAQNFGSWYCIGCENCHMYPDGAAWCNTLYLGGPIEWYPHDDPGCGGYDDRVCGP